MDLKVGAMIIVESEKATQTGRSGVIDEVLQEDPPRVRVRWSDGRTSILTPAAGAIRIVPEARAKARSRR